MSPIEIPKPRIDDSSESELWQLLSKGFEANRWRADFEEWKEKRFWSERCQRRLVAVLERHVLCGRTFKGVRVLDLGTGRGGLSVALALGGARVTAVDLRRRNCRILGLRAGRYGLSIPAAVAVGEYLPLASAAYDIVVCKDVTEHCRDPQRLIAEIARVLAPGGRAYVTFINRLSWIDPHYKLPGVNFVPRWLAETIIRVAGRSKPNIRDVQRLSDMHYYTLRGARRLARRQGLLFEDVTSVNLRDFGAGPFRRMAYRRLSLGAGTLETVLTRVR